MQGVEPVMEGGEPVMEGEEPVMEVVEFLRRVGKVWDPVSRLDMSASRMVPRRL